ncbi:MAG: hypothetical protein [Caudoviricetes sp.]|nr:MAG: hypothetical protein [Caudoviricetes sp.]
MSWHTKHFIDEAKVAHYQGLRRRHAGTPALAYQSFAERDYYMKMARGS